MPWNWKHRKKRNELINENEELRQLVLKLDAQLKLQIEMLYNSNIEIKNLKKRADNNHKFDNENLSRLNYKLRTPLNDIVGLTNLLEMITPDGEQKNYVAYIKKAGDNLVNLLNDVLFYLKSEYCLIPVDNKQMNLKALLEELLLTLKNKLTKSDDIEMYLNFDSRLPEVLYGDESKTRLIFLNLLNCILANNKTGIIVIQVQVVEKTDVETMIDFKISTMPVMIEDEINEKLFVPFTPVYKSNINSETSTGLELAIVKNLINLMGGDITHESNKNIGNSFLISLHFNNFQTQSDVVVQSTKTNIVKQTKNNMLNQPKNLSNLSVLLADDNEINQKFIQLSLKPLGLNIDIVDNGEDAVSRFTKNSYDVVLMDLQMPGINGLETTKIIRNIEKSRMTDTKTIIIGMSADSDGRLTNNWHTAGMDAQLNKPFKPQELLEIINEFFSNNNS